jgi:hypothetical protein
MEVHRREPGMATTPHQQAVVLVAGGIHGRGRLVRRVDGETRAACVWVCGKVNTKGLKHTKPPSHVGSNRSAVGARAGRSAADRSAGAHDRWTGALYRFLPQKCSHSGASWLAGWRWLAAARHLQL